MAQEFTINSSAIESKINQLLPSQGGFGAGVDFSASTMVIPIVDLTETAEGSEVRADLQTALSFNDVTSFNVENGTSTLINTTGYFRVFGDLSYKTTTGECTFQLTDGASTKILTRVRQDGSGNSSTAFQDFDFTVFLKAGDSLQAVSSAAGAIMFGCTKQLADISGNLTNPT